MSKPTKTAFELEAMIAAEMLLMGDCPIGLKFSVEGKASAWDAKAHTDDAACIANVRGIANQLRFEYDLE